MNLRLNYITATANIAGDLLESAWIRDSSEKSTFSHFSSVHPFSRLWAFANATRFFICLLFSAGFWALIRPWRSFRGDLRSPGLVELCCSGKGACLGLSTQQTVLPTSCLAGSAGPGLVKNISSLFKSFSYSLYLTLRHIEGVSHLSSGSGLQPLDHQRFGLRVNLRHVVRGQVPVDVKVWCAGVLFIHTHYLIDQLLITGQAVI